MDLRSSLPFARLDPVTYLPNRHQFVADFDNRPAGGGELIMVTLDTAKHFGDLLRAAGHECSDDFIRAGAARIRVHVPPEISIYHVSLLGFAFIYHGETEPLIAALLKGFRTELICGGIPVVTQLGIGIVACDAHIMDPQNLLRTALAAAHDGRGGGTAWSRYDPQLDTAHRRGFLLLTQLIAALSKNDQLRLHYQPKYDLRTGEIIGAEALLRWLHPTLGAISPAEIIPLAEATSLIGELSEWVLDTALAQTAIWHDQGSNLNITINVSPYSFEKETFAAHVLAALSRHNLGARSVELEIDDGKSVIKDPVLMRELRLLRKAGMRILLDDAGAGFSNLTYVSDLPSDIVKIDKSFTQRIGVQERSSALIRALIDLAHRMQCRVVAQGIETPEVYRTLAEWGCDEGQGFYMSRAMDAEAFTNFLKTPARSPSLLML